MSDNTSEVDQITGEMSRAGRSVVQIIASWRMMNPNATRVPRQVRRDINRVIKADLKEREFAHGQERASIERQVIEHRWKLVRDREIRAWDTQDTWFERQRQLAIEHERLRGAIHTTTHLNATERGQASRAASATYRDPHAPVGAVFDKPRGLNALRARLHDGFTRLKAGLAGPAEQQRVHQWQQQRDQGSQPTGRPDLSDPLLSTDPNQPIHLVPVDIPAPARTTATEQPPVTVQDLTKKIDLYRELVQYRGRYRGDNPDEMKPFDRDNARMRDRILTDAHQLGPDHAALVDAALSNIDQLHAEPPDRNGQASKLTQDQGSSATEIYRGQNGGAAGAPQLEPDSYQVEVISDPDGADPRVSTRIDRNILDSRADALTWAAEQLADHGSHAAVRVYPRYLATDSFRVEIDRDPVYSVAGRTDVIAAQLHDDAQEQSLSNGAAGANSAVPQQDPDAAPTTAAPERDPAYEVTVGSADFVQKHPDMAPRAEVTSLTEGYAWALDQLADDSKGWPANADVTVEIRPTGADAPAQQITGPHGDVVDQVITWQTDHEQSPLAEVERLRTELHTAHTEIGDLRTQITDLTKKFADMSPTQNGPASAPRPGMPTGPRMARPIFGGPVLPHPVANGLDR